MSKAGQRSDDAMRIAQLPSNRQGFLEQGFGGQVITLALGNRSQAPQRLGNTPTVPEFFPDREALLAQRLGRRIVALRLRQSAGAAKRPRAGGRIVALGCGSEQGGKPTAAFREIAANDPEPGNRGGEAQSSRRLTDPGGRP